VKKIHANNISLKEWPLDPGDNKIGMAKHAQVLAVGFDMTGTLLLTSISDPDFTDYVQRRFYVVTPGLRVPHNLGILTHIGSTRMDGKYPSHVFEVDSPEDSPRKGVSRAAVTNQQNAPVHGTSLQAGFIGGAIGSAVMIQ
jgi:hypothetical protein